MAVETIDLDSVPENHPLTHYELHLVPCKIGTTGPTEELKNGFQEDTAESNKEQSKTVTYLRGRKIVGKAVTPQKGDYKIVALTSFGTSDTTTSSYKQTAEISHIYNYEREGNEQRRDDEMDKFQEYLELTDLINQ
ncbi:uncharacterized protein LALA0_S11e03092g [Lachancea lanzarotensis]|uniref:LALA0S11e03092g1_1 n=1 Tax=Lachancea lanzarotensis TaxID=1245769 RepID=A0A0C7NFA0_9SACH|nr:uncharacterized protein LALA0_S11e03092g [Lachancea lanzarotensis]CEP64394.1 LALA0S11e03092g1_1 [Lachancea lanzarotensis]